MVQKYKAIIETKEKEIHYLRSQLSNMDLSHHVAGLPTIYIITPTYTRLVQVRVRLTWCIINTAHL